MEDKIKKIEELMLIAYKKYRENEVYGLDKEDKEVSNTFGDILGEL